MYVELVDALRCPRPHEDSWLVAAALETSGRCIVRGTLGCPLCHAEYPIEGGVARFDAPADARADTSVAPPIAAPHLDAGERAAEGMRLAALLGLTEAGGIVAVGGSWSLAVDAMLALADVRALVVEPADDWRPREPLGALRGAGLPVAPGALRGVALDVGTAGVRRLAAAVRALGPRGRLLAPAAVPLPDGVRELARDERHWVAEREAAHTGPLVALRRG